MTKKTGKRSSYLRGSSLQARISISYIWVTMGAVLGLFALYTVLLTGQVSYALSHPTSLSPLVSYPFQGSLVMVLVMTLLTPLIGGWFGTMTTREVKKRLRNLVAATEQFADGNYAPCVPLSRNDEIGQLEQQFNLMAKQLAENIAQRERLTEQNARLAERARISRELHDAISQDLFSIRMATGGLQAATATDHRSRLQPYVETLQEATERMIREMRALLLELRPLQLENRGLKDALEELIETYRTRLGVAIEASITSVQVTEKAEHALLRIAQEAFTNAIRHADATLIIVHLRPLAQVVELTITDNGKGFERHDPGVQHGLGLDLMQERAHELCGTFSLTTTPGQGTCIKICLPQECADD